MVGPPGSGKSTFCHQSILQNLAMDRPTIYVTTEYGQFDAETALKQQGLSEVEPGLLNYVDAYNETVGAAVSDRADTAYADCNDLSSIDIAISKLSQRVGRKPVFLVFDSLTSPYLFSGSEILKFVRQTLSRFATGGNAVVACIDEGCGKEEDLVAMMSLSNGVIKMDTENGKRVLNVVKHPKVEPTKIEVPKAKTLEKLWDMTMWKEEVMTIALEMMEGGAGAQIRTEIGDYVNLFWPNFAHWSNIFWDPRRFPQMTYEMSKKHGEGMKEMMAAAPWHQRLLFKSITPKSLSKVKHMKKMMKVCQQMFKPMRAGVLEYVEDASDTDEHYIRVHESAECWTFENVGAAMAHMLPASLAGTFKGFESWRGIERDWNAVETKCIGLGDPHCEYKLTPGEIEGLKPSLEKDISVLEKIHDRLTQHVMGFLLNGKPLVERPRLGSDAGMGGVFHVMVHSALAGERYRMAMRMGASKAGKEVGEHLMEAGVSEDEAVNRVLHLLDYCKVGRVTADETIRMKESCESVWVKFRAKRWEEPRCYFTTGFLNGFFSAVKNKHVKERKCIGVGDPYCEWEFT